MSVANILTYRTLICGKHQKFHCTTYCSDNLAVIENVRPDQLEFSVSYCLSRRSYDLVCSAIRGFTLLEARGDSPGEVYQNMFHATTTRFCLERIS
jgi:hypothetical protein